MLEFKGNAKCRISVEFRILARGFRTRARYDCMESRHALIFLFEHDLFEKPVSTFSDHALTAADRGGLAVLQ
jgi:hypothetical protein